MAKLRFYPVDLTYKIVRDKAAVYIYGRTPDNKQVCVVDEDFEPYFYVVPRKGASVSGLKDRLKEVRAESKDTVCNVIKTGTAKKLLKGEEARTDDRVDELLDVPGDGINGAKGLIHEHDRWIRSKGPSDSYSLTLAAG